MMNWEDEVYKMYKEGWDISTLACLVGVTDEEIKIVLGEKSIDKLSEL